LKKKGGYLGGKLDREGGGGGKRHGNNSDAMAKQFKMKVSIVTVVIKVIEYVEKKNNNDQCYQNMIFNA
jgi:hypothetical protein